MNLATEIRSRQLNKSFFYWTQARRHVFSLRNTIGQSDRYFTNENRQKIKIKTEKCNSRKVT